MTGSYKEGLREYLYMVPWTQKVCCPNSIPVYPREGAILGVFGTLKSAETFYYTLRSKKLTICVSYDALLPLWGRVDVEPHLLGHIPKKTILEREKEARPALPEASRAG